MIITRNIYFQIRFKSMKPELKPKCCSTRLEWTAADEDASWCPGNMNNSKVCFPGHRSR
jgi:hypothetical protein